MLVQEICDYNYDKEQTKFDGSYEYAALTKDLDVFAWAFAQTLKDKFGEQKSEEEFKKIEKEVSTYVTSKEGQNEVQVNRAKAVGDLIFDAIGTLYKLTGSEKKTADVMLSITAARNIELDEPEVTIKNMIRRVLNVK